MGQARWRKANDPLYGKVPQKAHAKGLIISPPTEISGTTVHVKNSQLDPQELRFSLLFWEKLMWPSSRAIHIPSGLDAQFLESEKILSRPDYTFSGDVATGMKVGFLQAFKDMDKKEPGAWSLASGERSLLVQDSDFEATGGSLVTLCRAIPIPKHDVPLEDILIFKQARTPELLTLRHKLDFFLSRISNAENQEEELKLCVQEIDAACSDLIKVGREWQIPFYLGDMRANFSSDPLRLLGGAGIAAELASLFGAGIPLMSVAALTGLGVGTIKIDPREIKYRPMRLPASPFRYSYLAHKELI